MKDRRRTTRLVPLQLPVALTLALLVGCQATRTQGAEPPSAAASAAPAVTRNLPDRGYDVDDYSIELTLYPERRSIEGSCTIRFAPTRPTLATMHLDLKGLDVRSVTDAEGRPLGFSHQGDDLVVTFWEPLTSSSLTEIEVAYGGRPITGLWYSGERADGSGPTQVFTQGQAENNRGWFPCFDHPSDRATTEVRVTMPASWVGILPGNRIDLVEEGAKRTEHWRMSVPHPTYLASLVAGEFLVIESEWNGVPLQFAAEPKYRAWLEASFEETDEILTFLSDYTAIRYPFSKYSQTCVANFPWGGMENISATTLTPLTLGDERSARDTSSASLVAHEAAHQWFGDLFTCADWSDIWLNEGFATYMTMLYFEETRGRDEFRVMLRQAQDEYIAQDQGPARRPTVTTAFQEPEDLMDTRAYQGAAARLHLLRFLLGDAVFHQGVRTYAAENAGKSVVTEDLKRAMEKVSGRSLDEFFAQWIFGSGFPEFRLDWRWDEEEETVVLDVRQTQAAAKGTPAAFRLPVDVLIRDEGGTVLHRIELTERNQIFNLPVAGQPTFVRFDDGGWIPKTVEWADRKTTEWLFIAHEDEDVNGRIDALRALGVIGAREYKRGKLEIVETIVAELGDRVRRDSSEHVRAAAATSLGQTQTLEARERLLGVARIDPSPIVRAAALRGLADFGPSAETLSLAEASFDQGYTWETMSAAADLYCAAAPELAYAWLTKKLFLSSPHDTLRANLLTRLGELPNRGVNDQLRRWANDETTSPIARAAALQALSKQTRDVVNNSRFITAFLEDENFRLRQSAIESLRRLGDENARRSLRAYYPVARTASERRVIEAVLSRPER